MPQATQHSTLYSVEIDPDLARNLAQQGASLLLLDVPPGTALGIDQQAFVVGEKFKGVKMLPPGPHFISCNAVSAHSGGGGGDFAPTIGFFVHLEPRQVVVRRWSAEEELLFPLQDPDEEERLSLAVRKFDFDANLAPYNLMAYSQWQALSSYISAGVIERLSPVGGAGISVTAEADPSLAMPRSAAESRLADQLRSRLTTEDSPTVSGAPAVAQEADPERDGQAAASTSSTPPQPQAARGVGRCFYTRLPRLAKVQGLTPQELTALNLDKSALLEQVIQKEYDRREDDLIGELQFSFLAFLLGQSLEGFAQWKELLRLVLACEEAPLSMRTPLYVRLLSAIRAQLEHCLAPGTRVDEAARPSPLGLPVTEELLADSFMKILFARFYEMVRSNSARVPRDLQAEAAALQRVLESGMGWMLSMEELAGESDDEDAPVVVDL